MRRDVRLGDVVGHRDATGVRVLHDDRGGPVTELVHKSPRGLGVEEVEIRELLAAVLHRVVPPALEPAEAVTSADLVGVLAVAQLLHTIEGQ